MLRLPVDQLHSAFSSIHPDSFSVDSLSQREPRTDAWLKPSVLRDQLLTGVVCLWYQVTWKRGSGVVSTQLSHRTLSSARSSENRATARAHDYWYRLMLKTIITYSGSGAELVPATPDSERNGDC